MIKLISKKAISRVVELFHLAQVKRNNFMNNANKIVNNDEIKKLVNDVKDTNLIEYVEKSKTDSKYNIYMTLPNPRLSGARKYIMPTYKLKVIFSKDGSFLGTRFSLKHHTKEKATFHPHINAEGEPCLGAHERMMNYILQENSLKDICKYASVFQNTWTRNDAYWDINQVHDSYSNYNHTIESIYNKLVVEDFPEHDKIIEAYVSINNGVKYKDYVVWKQTLQAKYNRILADNTNLRHRCHDFIYPSRSILEAYVERIKSGYVQSYFKFSNMLMDLYIWAQSSSYDNMYNDIENQWKKVEHINFGRVNQLTTGTSTFNQNNYMNAQNRQSLQYNFIREWIDIPKLSTSYHSVQLNFLHVGLRPSKVRKLINSVKIDTELLTNKNITASKRKLPIAFHRDADDMDKLAWVYVNIFNVRGARDNIISYESTPEEGYSGNITYWAGNVGAISSDQVELFFKLQTTHEILTELILYRASVVSERIVSALVNLKILKKLGYDKSFKDLLTLVEVKHNKHSRISNGDYLVVYDKRKCIELYDWIQTKMLQDLTDSITTSKVIVSDFTIEYNQYILSMLEKMTRRHNDIKTQATERKERTLSNAGLGISDSEEHARQSDLFAG